MHAQPTHRGLLGAAWGIGGLCLILVDAIRRLWPIGAEALGMELSGVHWAVAVPWVAFMAYSEGWRGFHLAFSPRAVRRALHLTRRPRPLWVVLAPMFVMGMLGATPRRLRVIWILTSGIVAAVVCVRYLPQPWRGIVDLGVVVGLSIGLVSTIWHAARAAAGITPAIDPDLPPNEARAPS